MSFDLKSRGTFLRRFFRANMLLGFGVFVLSIYFMVTGEYSNYQAQHAADAVLGRYAMGSLLYIAFFWYICAFSKPFLSQAESPQ